MDLAEPPLVTSSSPSSVRLGEGSVGLVRYKNVVSGRHTHIPEDIRCNISMEIGAFCSIASGLVIVSGQHPGVDNPHCVSNFPFFEGGWGEYPSCRSGAETSIGNDVWIGQNVTIMEGVRVSDGAVLAAGSVISRDVNPYEVVAGNPARFVKLRFDPYQIADLLKIKWWDWTDEEIKENLPLMSNAFEFTLAH